MITVVDADAAGLLLRAGLMDCPEPGCGGRLRVWSRARPRPVMVAGGRTVELRPDRGLCRSCKVTQVLLPSWCLPRRAYGVEVVGAALFAAAEGAGCARAAAAARVPAGTVRGWIRAVTRGAGGLIAAAVEVARAVGGDDGACWPAGITAVGPVRAALHALAGAAQALTRSQPDTARSGGGGELTGINYLGLVAAEYRRQVHRQLRLVDPTGAAAGVSPWQQVTVITGGRLLTTPSG